MKNFSLTFAAIIAFVFAATQPIAAQRARHTSQQTNTAPQQQQYEPLAILVYAGTPVELETIMPADGKDLRVGQTIDFRVKYDVIVRREIVIAAGSMARGIITRLERPKMMGKGGIMEIQPQYVTAVDNQVFPINAAPIRLEGKKNGWAWAGVAVGVATGGLAAASTAFIKGKNARIESGMTVFASLAATREVYLED